VVAGLLQEPRAGEGLLTPLDPEELRVERLLPRGLPRAKPRWRPPLFPLLTRQAFELTETILARWDNPYLAWAREVEELRLSRPLYARRPDLPGEVLCRVHFATLLAREILRTEGGEDEERQRLWVRLEAYVAQAKESQEQDP
jgi:hypothetical protein